MKIELDADKITFSGPNVDGGYKITFHTGEYSQNQIAELMKIPQNTALKVTIETNGHEAAGTG